MPKKYQISKWPLHLGNQIINTLNYLIGHQNEGFKLHQAIQDKNYELIAEILADKKTDPNLRDAEGNPPLYYAFKLEDEKIIKALLNHSNIDLNSPLTLELSPVQSAALSGNHEYLKLLLDTKKVEVNVADEVGDNILSYAIYSGNIESVKLLLDHPELNLTHKNTFGCNALHLAAMNRQLEVVQLLLQQKKGQENLDSLNNSSHHFQHMLLNAFDFEDLTLIQQKDLKEIFRYKVLLKKKEINNISNQALKTLIMDTKEAIYQSQYGKMKPSHTSLAPKEEKEFIEHSLSIEEDLPPFGALEDM
jgi:ankyrin repeat protein